MIGIKNVLLGFKDWAWINFEGMLENDCPWPVSAYVEDGPERFVGQDGKVKIEYSGPPNYKLDFKTGGEDVQS